MRTCDTCEHWRKLVNWHDRDDWTIKTEEEYWEAGIAMRTAEKGKVIGECLRYPPVTVRQDKKEKNDAGYRSIFPDTAPYERCGEWSMG